MKSRAGLIRKLEGIRIKVGRDRDRLRDILEEYQAVLDSCDRADEAMDEAIAALSEYA